MEGGTVQCKYVQIKLPYKQATKLNVDNLKKLIELQSGKLKLTHHEMELVSRSAKLNNGSIVRALELLYQYAGYQDSIIREEKRRIRSLQELDELVGFGIGLDGITPVSITRVAKSTSKYIVSVCNWRRCQWRPSQAHIGSKGSFVEELRNQAKTVSHMLHAIDLRDMSDVNVMDVCILIAPCYSSPEMQSILNHIFGRNRVLKQWNSLAAITDAVHNFLLVEENIDSFYHNFVAQFPTNNKLLLESCPTLRLPYMAATGHVQSNFLPQVKFTWFSDKIGVYYSVIRCIVVNTSYGDRSCIDGNVAVQFSWFEKLVPKTSVGRFIPEKSLHSHQFVPYRQQVHDAAVFSMKIHASGSQRSVSKSSSKSDSKASSRHLEDTSGMPTDILGLPQVHPPVGSRDFLGACPTDVPIHPDGCAEQFLEIDPLSVIADDDATECVSPLGVAVEKFMESPKSSPSFPAKPQPGQPYDMPIDSPEDCDCCDPPIFLSKPEVFINDSIADSLTVSPNPCSTSSCGDIPVDISVGTVLPSLNTPTKTDCFAPLFQSPSPKTNKSHSSKPDGKEVILSDPIGRLSDDVGCVSLHLLPDIADKGKRDFSPRKDEVLQDVLDQDNTTYCQASNERECIIENNGMMCSNDVAISSSPVKMIRQQSTPILFSSPSFSTPGLARDSTMSPLFPLSRKSSSKHLDARPKTGGNKTSQKFPKKLSALKTPTKINDAVIRTHEVNFCADSPIDESRCILSDAKYFSPKRSVPSITKKINAAKYDSDPVVISMTKSKVEVKRKTVPHRFVSTSMNSLGMYASLTNPSTRAEARIESQTLHIALCDLKIDTNELREIAVHKICVWWRCVYPAKLLQRRMQARKIALSILWDIVARASSIVNQKYKGFLKINRKRAAVTIQRVFRRNMLFFVKAANVILKFCRRYRGRKLTRHWATVVLSISLVIRFLYRFMLRHRGRQSASQVTWVRVGYEFIILRRKQMAAKKKAMEARNGFALAYQNQQQIKESICKMEAATMIQKYARRMLGKTQVAKKKRDKRLQVNLMFFLTTHVARINFKNLRPKLKAAKVIQKSFRGWISRKWLFCRILAAITIGRAYKRYKSRCVLRVDIRRKEKPYTIELQRLTNIPSSMITAKEVTVKVSIWWNQLLHIISENDFQSIVASKKPNLIYVTKVHTVVSALPSHTNLGSVHGSPIQIKGLSEPQNPRSALWGVVEDDERISSVVSHSRSTVPDSLSLPVNNRMTQEIVSVEEEEFDDSSDDSIESSVNSNPPEMGRRLTSRLSRIVRPSAGRRSVFAPKRKSRTSFAAVMRNTLVKFIPSRVIRESIVNRIIRKTPLLPNACQYHIEFGDTIRIPSCHGNTAIKFEIMEGGVRKIGTYTYFMGQQGKMIFKGGKVEDNIKPVMQGRGGKLMAATPLLHFNIATGTRADWVYVRVKGIGPAKTALRKEAGIHTSYFSEWKKIFISLDDAFYLNWYSCRSVTEPFHSLHMTSIISLKILQGNVLSTHFDSRIHDTHNVFITTSHGDNICLRFRESYQRKQWERLFRSSVSMDETLASSQGGPGASWLAAERALVDVGNANDFGGANDV